VSVNKESRHAAISLKRKKSEQEDVKIPKKKSKITKRPGREGAS